MWTELHVDCSHWLVVIKLLPSLMSVKENSNVLKKIKVVIIIIIKVMIIIIIKVLIIIIIMVTQEGVSLSLALMKTEQPVGRLHTFLVMKW